MPHIIQFFTSTDQNTAFTAAHASVWFLPYMNSDKTGKDRQLWEWAGVGEANSPQTEQQSRVEIADMEVQIPIYLWQLSWQLKFLFFDDQ